VLNISLYSLDYQPSLPIYLTIRMIPHIWCMIVVSSYALTTRPASNLGCSQYCVMSILIWYLHPNYFPTR